MPYVSGGEGASYHDSSARQPTRPTSAARRAPWTGAATRARRGERPRPHHRRGARSGVIARLPQSTLRVPTFDSQETAGENGHAVNVSNLNVLIGKTSIHAPPGMSAYAPGPRQLTQPGPRPPRSTSPESDPVRPQSSTSAAGSAVQARVPSGGGTPTTRMGCAPFGMALGALAHFKPLRVGGRRDGTPRGGACSAADQVANFNSELRGCGATSAANLNNRRMKGATQRKQRHGHTPRRILSCVSRPAVSHVRWW